MEPVIESNSWISFIVIGLSFLAFLFVAGYNIVQIGKRNAERAKDDELHYNLMYENIQTKIFNNLSKDENKYKYYENYIRALIGTLENLPYKNEEKTRVLWDNFNKEFKK